jgi:hypothetical protein
MEAASPEHLKDRLHAAQMKRLDSEGLMSKALAALESGSEHETLLTERVTGFDFKNRIIEFKYHF